MNSQIPSTARLFRAKTVRVHSPNSVEVDLDLEFGVCLRRVVVFDGFPLSSVPAGQRELAMHCLVILLGGRNLLVQPNPKDRSAWGRQAELRARVFRAERVYGTPVGLTTNLPDVSGAHLDVVPFLHYLAERGFSLKDVKAVVNGRGNG